MVRTKSTAPTVERSTWDSAARWKTARNPPRTPRPSSRPRWLRLVQEPEAPLVPRARSEAIARGLNAGVAAGQLLLGPKSGPLAAGADPKQIALLLSGVANGNEVTLTLDARSLVARAQPRVIAPSRSTPSTWTLRPMVTL